MQQLEIEVLNSKTVLISVIRCIQKLRIPINHFTANVNDSEHGTISICIDAEIEELNLIKTQLTDLTDVKRVKDNRQRPSAEIKSIYEE